MSCHIVDVNLAVLTAVRLDARYSKAHHANTPVVVMMFSEPPLAGSSGSRPVCMTSSGPQSYSGRLMNLGVICQLSTFSSWTQVCRSFTDLRTWFGIDGKH